MTTEYPQRPQQTILNLILPTATLATPARASTTWNPAFEPKLSVATRYHRTLQDTPYNPKRALVVGSRYCEGGIVKGWTVIRRITSVVANRIAGSLVKLLINDFTSGFRCYSKRCVQKVLPKLHSQTYEIQIETIRQAKLQNLKVVETPITFENRKKGKSKLTLTEIVAFSKYIIKVMLEQNKTRAMSNQGYLAEIGSNYA